MTTLGTHNTLDGKAPATDFADVLIFTEAIPDKVRTQLAATHDVYPCRFQRDLVIAFRKGTWEDEGSGYRLAHPGWAKVTPRRGTYKRKGKLNGRRTKVYAEHRINAAFPPFKRGEPWFRPKMWKRHTAMTLRMMRRDVRKGWDVLAGGDPNTPRGVSAYQGVLYEVGDHFDRLGSTRRLREVAVLSRVGSDHPRLRARVG